jgi:aspartyl-tRNA(Asn)/glutamyl-tRNA(Gln) amidotransferase subunit C
MAITRDTVLHVAKLARISLADDEVERMKHDLSRILEYVEELGALQTADVPETAHVAVDAAPLRPDTTRAGVPRELALREAPRSADGGFAVPAFVDET